MAITYIGNSLYGSPDTASGFWSSGVSGQHYALQQYYLVKDPTILPNFSPERLGECITALETVKDGRFRMHTFWNRYPKARSETDCGSPACVLGHHEFAYGKGLCSKQVSEDQTIAPRTMAYFGITHDQFTELFSDVGCGRAKTPAQAIAYLKDFIARHTPEKTTIKIKVTEKVAV